MSRPFLFFLVVSGLMFSERLPAQDSADRNVVQQPTPPEPQYKRLFGIVPNFKTSPSLVNYKPLSAKEKFKLSMDDAFDRGTFALAAAFAGKGQLVNDNPSFGQGVEGYAHRFVTSYGDWAIGDFMTEAVYPVMLHQDPRYFRKGSGSAFGRLGWAVGQIFWTHTDSGGHMVNFSELAGNASAVAISQAYYPDNRDAHSAVQSWAVQVGVDMASNVMKEFYPDLRRALRRHKDLPASSTH
jgi:hypothetical protein